MHALFVERFTDVRPVVSETVKMLLDLIMKEIGEFAIGAFMNDSEMVTGSSD